MIKKKTTQTNKAMNKTNRQLSDECFEDLCKQFTRSSIELAIGDKQAFFKYVWSEGAVIDFWKMLEQPEHDWQSDC